MKNKNLLIGLCAIVSLIIIFIFIKQIMISKNIYSFNGNSFSYSQDRGKLEYISTYSYSNDSIDVFNVRFRSRDFLNYTTWIYGLLFVPKTDHEVPGIVFLPGGGVTKEMSSVFCQNIAKQGYAVLSIDQRGLGQTKGYYLGPEQDYEIFAKGDEPIQHLSVYDGLRASDLLKETKGVDKEKIAIMGESMGARYALIAAAIDKRLKGAILISFAGYHFKKSGQIYDNYISSIDPDSYIWKVSPNKIFILQGDNDSVVRIEDAKKSFELAKEPKEFFTAKGCGHGYCTQMKDEISNDLRELFSL